MPTMPKLIEPSASSTAVNDLVGVERTRFPSLWPELWPVLSRAVERGDGSYAECDVMMALMAGQWQAWINSPLTTVVITEVVAFPQQRKLIVRYVAGELEHILPHLEQLVGYARAHGCRLIESNHARRGWSGILPGWEEGRVVISREVPQ